jgi:hypothetical protein
MSFLLSLLITAILCLTLGYYLWLIDNTHEKVVKIEKIVQEISRMVDEIRIEMAEMAAEIAEMRGRE